MSRRKQGRAVHGWLILDKPPGFTSAAMVAKAKWALGARKAGHAGTLDPAATGLLAIAFGEATKTVPCIADAPKAYRFTVRWGAATTTDDAEGTVLAESDARPNAEAISAALPAFTGDILQVPPQVSAVKVDGVRAYALARTGETPDLAPRPLHVSRLDLIARPDPDTAVFEMVCGKGGYVRAIARDLGDALGCLGHVADLRRLWSGPFDLTQATDLATLERLAGHPDLEACLRPLDSALADLPQIVCDASEALALRNGATVPALGLALNTRAWASHDGTPLALGICTGAVFRPERVFVFGPD